MALSQKKCLMCENTKGEREFFSSSSKMYGDKKLPICKTCIKNRFRKLYECNNKDIYKAVKHFCMNLDLYYDKEILDKCIEKENKVGELILRYIVALNRNNTTFVKTSLDNIELLNDSGLDDELEISDFKVTKDIVNKWGKTYTKDELESLEAKFKDFSEYYPSEKKEEIEIIKDLCKIEISEERALESGDVNAHIKYMGLKSNKMNELNVIPSKKKGFGEDKDVTFGTLIKRIEKEEPIPDTHKEFDDIDKIEYIMNRYFKNPMRKVLGEIPAKYTSEDEIYDFEDKE